MATVTTAELLEAIRADARAAHARATQAVAESRRQLDRDALLLGRSEECLAATEHAAHLSAASLLKP